MRRKKDRCERMYDKETPCDLPSQLEVVKDLHAIVEKLKARIFMYKKEIKSMNRSLERKTLKIDKMCHEFRALREAKESIEARYHIARGKAFGEDECD